MAWPDGRLERSITISGLNAPTSIPPAVGITYVDRASGKVYKSIQTTNVLPRWKELSGSHLIDVSEYGAVGDGVTLNAVALQAAWDDAITNDGILFFPAGTYLLEAEIVVAEGRWGCIGEGRRTSVIKATDTFDMFACTRTSGRSGSIIMQDIGFDGDDLATAGIIMQSLNFSRFLSVEMINVNGIGLSLNSVEDCFFSGIEVRRSGNWASSLPGIRLVDGIGTTNSNIFIGGTIERCKYHAFELDSAHATKIIGMKGHGLVPLVDATTPNEFDLINANNCKRLIITVCQLTNANRNAVNVTGSIGKVSTNITSNTFFRTTNYQGILSAQTGSIDIGVSATTLNMSSAGSWAVDDAIRVTGAGAAGVDLYTFITAISGSTFTISDAAGTTVTAATLFTVNAAWNVNISKGYAHVDGNLMQPTDSAVDHSSYMKSGGDIKLASSVASFSGKNSHIANPDTHVDRNSMDRYKITTQIGNNYYWTDNAGKLRVKTSPATSDQDGTIVGMESTIDTLANNSSPEVASSKTSNIFITGGTTTIVNFTGGYLGQVITILSEHAITITDGTNIFLNGSVNFVMASGDSLTLVRKADSNWYEIARMVN